MNQLFGYKGNELTRYRRAFGEVSIGNENIQTAFRVLKTLRERNGSRYFDLLEQKLNIPSTTTEKQGQPNGIPQALVITKTVEKNKPPEDYVVMVALKEKCDVSFTETISGECSIKISIWDRRFLRGAVNI